MIEIKDKLLKGCSRSCGLATRCFFLGKKWGSNKKGEIDWKVETISLEKSPQDEKYILQFYDYDLYF